jgi:hypothetical protein
MTIPSPRRKNAAAVVVVGGSGGFNQNSNTSKAIKAGPSTTSSSSSSLSYIISLSSKSTADKLLWAMLSFAMGVLVNQSFHSTSTVTTTMNNNNNNINNNHNGLTYHTITNTTSNTNNNNNNNNNNKQIVIYGHLHKDKTGGTNLNGLMAAKFDNVCGNKGYSYDSYQVNARLFNGTPVQGDRIRGEKRQKHGGNFIIDPKQKMESIGYENCDYISNEGSYQIWTKDIVQQLNFTDKNWILELHVPCRDPIEHLLSTCNHHNRKFICPDPTTTNSTINYKAELEQQVKNCLWSGGPMDKRKIVLERNPRVNNPKTRRFNLKLNNTQSINLKCFQPFPIESYINYMGNHLRQRKIEPQYYIRSTNKQRNKNDECLLSSNDKYATNIQYLNEVRQLLMKIDTDGYYKFCNNCLGTQNELPLLHVV